MAEIVLPPPHAKVTSIRIEGDQSRPFEDRVAVELPFELRLNGRSHMVLMVSPILLEELALGICLSEGLVDSPEQVLGISLGQADVDGVGAVFWADVSLPPELSRRANMRRLAPAATSCGLCGLESFKQLDTQVKALADSGPCVDLACVFALMEAMKNGQNVFSVTGGTHAAALGDQDGRLLVMAEDVGRHNALDKAIGLGIKAGLDLSGCLTSLSGRLSYEMALKAARVGLPILGSVSAPTSLSLGLLERFNVTMVGFVRGQRATVYTHPERIRAGDRPIGK